MRADPDSPDDSPQPTHPVPATSGSGDMPADARLHATLLECLSRSHLLALARPASAGAGADPLFSHVEDLVAVQLRTLLHRERLQRELAQLQALVQRQSVELGTALDCLRGGPAHVAAIRQPSGPWRDLVRIAEDVQTVEEAVLRTSVAVDAAAQAATLPAAAHHESTAEVRDGLSLRVHLFGELRISIHGRPIRRWPHGRGQQVFLYLLLHRDAPVHKSRLLEAFWPHIEPRAARNNLNVSIYYLRQELSRYDKAAAFVEYRDECYALADHLDVWLDAEAFDACVQVADRHEQCGRHADAIRDYEAADALAGGAFLDCERDQEWAVVIREQWRRKRAHVVARLAELSFAQGDLHKCMTWCQKRVELDWIASIRMAGKTTIILAGRGGAECR